MTNDSASAVNNKGNARAAENARARIPRAHTFVLGRGVAVGQEGRAAGEGRVVCDRLDCALHVAHPVAVRAAVLAQIKKGNLAVDHLRE